MSIGFGLGNHRMIVIDVVAQLLYGSEPQVTVRTGAQRLNSTCPNSLDNYNRCLEKLLTKHCLKEKQLESQSYKDSALEQFCKKVNKIDK